MENSEAVKIETDLRQTPEYGRFLERVGWKTVQVAGRQMFLRKLGPVKIAKMQRVDLPIPVADMERIFRQEKIIMCKLEPREGQSEEKLKELKKLGFAQDKWPLLGAKTLRVNIRPAAEALMSSFKKDARYCLKKALAAAVDIKLNDWGVFYDTWKKAAKNKDLWIPPKKDVQALQEAFGEKCFCLTAGKMAGVVVIVVMQTAYYYYSAALPEAKKLQLPYRMVWEGMREAKNRGALVWDFEGIYDKRWPTKGWKGFTHFKKSFGGVEIEFPGSFIKWRWPF